MCIDTFYNDGHAGYLAKRCPQTGQGTSVHDRQRPRFTQLKEEASPMKKIAGLILCLAMVLTLAAPGLAQAAQPEFHIGIVTGSVSQSEDDRRGAEAFQAMYGEEMVKLAIYPDNFTEELETTIQCMSSKITSTISVQLMPLYKSPHITKGLSSAAVLTGRGGNVTISTSKSLGEKNR